MGYRSGGSGHRVAGGERRKQGEGRGVEQDAETVTLYRPVGPAELALVWESGARRWPPRLDGQPIFYPVTNAAYAAEIAQRWNVPESGAGAVTRFRVQKGFMARYAIHTVGASHHQEWWIPAEDLEALNDHIVGLIEVIQHFGAPHPVEGRGDTVGE